MTRSSVTTAETSSAGVMSNAKLSARVPAGAADPAEEAIRLYRACGFADVQGQFSFQRTAAG